MVLITMLSIIIIDKGIDDSRDMLSTADDGIDDFLEVLSTADNGIDDYAIYYY